MKLALYLLVTLFFSLSCSSVQLTHHQTSLRSLASTEVTDDPPFIEEVRSAAVYDKPLVFSEEWERAISDEGKELLLKNMKQKGDQFLRLKICLYLLNFFEEESFRTQKNILTFLEETKNVSLEVAYRYFEKLFPEILHVLELKSDQEEELRLYMAQILKKNNLNFKNSEKMYLVSLVGGMGVLIRTLPQKNDNIKEVLLESLDRKEFSSQEVLIRDIIQEALQEENSENLKKLMNAILDKK